MDFLAGTQLESGSDHVTEPGPDVVTDLASMQQSQSTKQSPRNLRPPVQQQQPPRSPSMQVLHEDSSVAHADSIHRPTLSRRSSAIQVAADHPMTDAPRATLQPRTFNTSSLDQAELEAVSELTKQLADNTFLYESHARLIRLLHKGLVTHVCPTEDAEQLRNPLDYDLLGELRQARLAMDSRFPVGEELWIEWLEDECMLARNTDERLAVMELCQKAVQDEVGSTRIWRLYGDWMWTLYRTAHDISGVYETNSLEQHPVVSSLLAKSRWTADEKEVGREVFAWDLIVGVWESAVKATEWHLDSSQLVWDPYAEILIHDMTVRPSGEKMQHIGRLFHNRLRQPHATWDDTFQKFSQFVTTYDSGNYEAIMVSTNKDSAQAKQQFDYRLEFESKLQRAVQYRDANTEWAVMTEYLDWEVAQLSKPKKYVHGLDIFVALLQRANLRFPTDAELWEDHIDFLTENEIDRVLQVARNATRHCPWSGNLWSKRLVVLEAAGSAFNEIEDVKHHATSSGLLEGKDSVDELVKVCVAWCGFLRRRAFASDAGEDERDVAEVGIRSELENTKAIGEKKSGKGYKSEAVFRMHRIYIKFLSQGGRYEEVRNLWLQLSDTYGGQWQFWDNFYLWEMSVWVQGTPPEHATEALRRSIYHSDLDWPERMIESYLHHCAQHESVQKLQSVVVEARKVRKQVEKRRAKEAADTAAAQAAYTQQHVELPATMEVDDTSASTKRKRQDSTVVQADLPVVKRHKSAETEKDLPGGDASSATAQIKRDRENTTVIVKRLPSETNETKVRQFFRDCGTILSIQLVPSDEGSDLTATIEFESKEDVLSAQTKSMKLFEGHSVNIQVGTGTTLFVTNYPPEADEEYIRKLFDSYGEVVDVRLPSLKYDVRRRFCYVQFLSSEQAQAAAKALDGMALGRNLTLNVKLSDPTAKKSRSGATEEGREIHVKNVDKRATESELKTAFSPYGDVKNVRILTTIDGRSKGFAFVVYATKEEANAALEMNLKEFKGRALNVTMSVPNAKGPKTVATTRASSEAVSQQGDQGSTDVVMNGATEAASPPTTQPTDQHTTPDHWARTLILKNIPDTVNDARIRALAEQYGPLMQVKIKPDLGEATVEYRNVKDVGTAEMNLNGFEILKGVALQVAVRTSKPRDTGFNAHTDNDANRGKKKPSMPFAPVATRRPAMGNAAPGRAGGGPRGQPNAISKGVAKSNGTSDDAMDTNGDGVEKKAKKSNADFRAFLN